jgi:type II restriction enzyme
MSNSKNLRKTHTAFGGGRTIFNDAAKEFESDLFSVVDEVRQKLVKKYPGFDFIMQKRLPKRDVASKLGRNNYNPENARSFINPDGGILYLVKEGKKYAILISEAKKQGTNKDRLKEGKKEQSKGNAIERAHKNYNEFCLYCNDLPYLPYVMFAFGCDFKNGSSINDRLDAMTNYLPRNVNYVGREKVATIYIREKQFTKHEMFKLMEDVAVKSIKVLQKEVFNG